MDFLNHTFQEFVYDVISIDIYTKYHGISKAKILRAIIAENDNFSVDKLLLELMRYMQEKGMIVDGDRDTFKQCADIGNRLIGKSSDFKQAAAISTNTTKPITSLIDYEKYIKELQSLSDYDIAHSHGDLPLKSILKIF